MTWVQHGCQSYTAHRVIPVMQPHRPRAYFTLRPCHSCLDELRKVASCFLKSIVEPEPCVCRNLPPGDSQMCCT